MDAFEAISLPEPSAITGKKCFTAEDANRSLVLVRRIVSDIVNHYHDLCELHSVYKTQSQRGNSEEAEQTRQRYIDITDRLSELRNELEEIGCELKDLELGLVDFPSLFDGREIFLCWKLGESDVHFWHEVTAGYKGRQPLNCQPNEIHDV